MGTRSKTLKDLNNLNLMALGAGMAAIAADAAAAAGGAGAGEESMEGVMVVAGTPSPRACLLTPGRGTRGATNAEVPSSAMSSPVRAPADHDEMHMGIPPPDPSAAMHRGMRELLREEFAEQRDLIREEFSRGMAALAARVTETEARVAGVIAAVATLDARITSKFAQADVAFGPLLRLVPELSVAKDGVADLDERMGRMEKHEVLALAQFHVDQEPEAHGNAGRQTRTSWRSPKPGIPVTLFSGTTVLSARGAGSGRAPLGMVARTGFNTAKGRLLRSILFPKQHDLQFARQALYFIAMMLSVASVFYAIDVAFMVQYGASGFDIFIKCGASGFDVFIKVCVPAFPHIKERSWLNALLD
ncbi:hypothetical protein FOA52_003574 [Chlamydomonas sp. UWO 241]|nr:hypothetical protein FOA52_003574 [Chlamydomonas sp. UWO 241]